MPLIKGKSKKAFSENVSKEMESGKPQKQALAIAYSLKRRARKKMSKGGELDLRDEHMSGVDHEYDHRGEEMLDSKPLRHGEEENAKDYHMSKADDRDEREMDMLHQDEDHLGNPSLEQSRKMAEGGEVEDMNDHIDMILKKRRKMAKGGQVDLQDNEDEHLNLEDQLSFEAARKKTYFDLSQADEQPMDSNEHGDELSDEDMHNRDMIEIIRRKFKKR